MLIIMKTNEVISALSSIRTLNERFAWCYKNGLSPVTRHMGKGGVFQVKEVNGVTRVQISAGWGRYNYAWVVELPSI